MPKEYGSKDYRGAEENIIKKYSEAKSLVSVYNWGSPSVPGISDMDIILVFGKNAEHLPFLKRSFYFMDAKTRYLARHPFIFIGEDSFKKIRYVYPSGTLKLLHGKNIKLQGISSSENYYSGIALLDDIIIRHYPRDFLWQSLSGNINVRDTLLRLNSLKYSIKALEGIAKNKSTEWSGKLALIEKLRKNWFGENDLDLLASLNDDAVGIAMGIIEIFKEFLAENNLVKISSGDRVNYGGIKNKAVFTKKWGKEKALQEMSSNMKNKNGFHSILPIELSAQLIECSRYKGLISDYIKKKITNNVEYELKYKNIIAQRIGILNSQAELASRLRHSDFAAFFDFGCRNRHGVNNWILNLADRVRF